VAGGDFWERIFVATTPTPRNNDVGTRLEIDLTRQVILMITDNQVWKIVHCSTGSSGRRTRTGHFQISTKQKGWVAAVTVRGMMYYPSYVVSLTAIHGYRSVPPYPASHGCIRVPVWMAEEIFYETPSGTTVDIYYSG
jgi:lipoprotein-anchoring transpeptidase ErfK/SrfK